MRERHIQNFIPQTKMLAPKAQNQNTGYYFSVTDDEIRTHLSRSCKDIFSWIESTNRFVYQLQTPQERLRSRMSKVI
jgi:hypothetical protein